MWILNTNFKFFLSSVLLFQLYSVCKCSDDLKRIVGGSATSIANIPYVVQIRQDGNYICAGSLIRPQFVVTAAHCTVGLRPSQLIVVGGATTLAQTGVRRAVSKIIMPRGFSMNNFNRDVAVLKLRSPLTGSNIAPIALNTQGLTTSTSLRVSGWGRTSENASGVSTQLRTVIVPVVGKSRCTAQYRGYMALTSTMFCASAPGRDSCSGDSGGPAVSNGQLSGIVSFGRGCAQPNFPGIYTSIRSVRGIIQNALRQ
ncbi:trypsin alpha-3 [Stomoxys calcitrans]|uniref:trypsin alpha-3 n=1 Tax=Stomoxys calcitrans TaxID=35570 RepID=UPI0027E21C29|nr:trypsin alpha-3 [Stomoxys calcitrans]